MPAISKSGYLEIVLIKDAVICFAVMENNLLNRHYAVTYRRIKFRTAIAICANVVQIRQAVMWFFLTYFTVLRQKIITVRQNSTDRTNYCRQTQLL